MTFTQLAKKYPPILCRLLASGTGLCNNRVLFNTESIASFSKKLTVFEVQLMSNLTSWDDVPYSKMLAFLKGCNIDFTDWRRMNNVNTYLARQASGASPWSSLRRSGEWLTYYEPLLKRYAASLTINQ